MKAAYPEHRESDDRIPSPNFFLLNEDDQHDLTTLQISSFVDESSRKALLVAVAVPRRSAQEIPKNEAASTNKP
jgi:hypothetical protein